MDGQADVKRKGMHCSSESLHRPAKRACVDLAAASGHVLKEEDHTPVETCCSNEVSKFDPPAVKRPPARYVEFGTADWMSNATSGVDQEDQDDTEEEITRRDDRDKGAGITEEANDGLQHDDEVNGQEKNDSHLEAPSRKRRKKSFEQRIEELKAFKEKHGHVRVTEKHDQSLGSFCREMRYARREKGNRTGTSRTVITEDRIKALDKLGFDWGDKTKTRTRTKSSENRIEEMKTFKAKHGHVRVSRKQDKSLYSFCDNMRSARRGTGTATITEDVMKALDELGFDWGDKQKSFEERIEELKVFKAKHGHVRVTVKQDKSLGLYCKIIRSSRRGTAKRRVITEDRIKALDELGFEWGHQELGLDTH